MENENKQEFELEQIEEAAEIASEKPEHQEETVTLSKKDFTRLNRKAIAYDSGKNQQINKPKQQEMDEDIVRTVQELKGIESRRQYGYENGLTPEETDNVFKFANGKPTKETLENPFVKAGLDSLRAQKRVESNTPSSSLRSSAFAGKQFSELSEDDRQKAFEEKMSAIRK